jgi:hypothetical protein
MGWCYFFRRTGRSQNGMGVSGRSGGLFSRWLVSERPAPAGAPPPDSA